MEDNIRKNDKFRNLLPTRDRERIPAKIDKVKDGQVKKQTRPRNSRMTCTLNGIFMRSTFMRKLNQKQSLA